MPMNLDILSNTLSNTFLNSRNRSVKIDRPIYTEDDLVNLYCKKEQTDKTSFISKLPEKLSECCSAGNILKGLFLLFPVITWLPKYKFKQDIVRDIAAGLTLGIIQIPQGMAYGMLTSLPAIYGLYVSLIPVLIYFIFGTSKHLNIGTFAIICLMVGEVVENNVNPQLPLHGFNSTTSPEYKKGVESLKLNYAVTASFLVGILQVSFGLLRFGFITIFLSDPLISGFTTGAAFHIFSSQVKHLVGMSIPRAETTGVFGLFKLYIYIFKHVTSINYGALIIGVVAAILLYVIKYFAQKYKEKIKFPIPAELIVVILGTSLSYGFKFNKKFDIQILNNVPTGMPPLSLPHFSKMGSMVVDCLGISIVSYAISISIAKAFAKKNKYEISPNQELFAHGAVNIVGSFFSCFVASGSLSRSLIQENLGRSQLAAAFSCVLVVLTLTVLAPWFEPLPNAILAAIVLIALKGLFKQFSVLKDLIKIAKIDAFVWISSFIAVFCLGVDYGLAVGLVINLLTTVFRTSRPSVSLLGHIPQTEIYASVSADNDELSIQEIPGVKIFQFHAPLLYINVDHFQEALFKATVNPAACSKISVPKCYSQEKLADGISEHYFMDPNAHPPPKPRHRSGSQMLSATPLKKIKRSGSLDSPNNFKCTIVPVDPIQTPFCPLHTIILDCSQISYADTMGIGMLVSVCSEFKNLDVDVHLCNTPKDLLRLLDIGGFIQAHGSDHIFVSVHDAVQYSLANQHPTGVCEHSMQSINNDSMYIVVEEGNSDAADSTAMLPREVETV